MNGLHKPCQAWAESISLSAAGCLSSDEQQDVDRHLETCPSCLKRFEQLSAVCRTASELRLHGEDAGAAIARRVMSAVEGELPQRRGVGRLWAWATAGYGKTLVDRQQPIPLTRRIFTVKNMTISAGLLSAVAVLLIVAIMPSNPTFADVMEKIRNAHTLSASVVTVGKKVVWETEKKQKIQGLDTEDLLKQEIKGGSVFPAFTSKGTLYIRDDGSVRSQTETEIDQKGLEGCMNGEAAGFLAAAPDISESVYVYNAGAKEGIMMFPKEKLFCELEKVAGAAGCEPTQGNTAVAVWFQQLKQSHGKPEKELGKKTLNGKKVKGFLVKVADGTQSVWIDEATGNIEAIEFEDKGGTMKMTVGDFKFDDPAIDDSVFSTRVPVGYKKTQTPPTVDCMIDCSRQGSTDSAIVGEDGPPGDVIDMPARDFSSEAGVISALTEYTSASGGEYPDQLEDIDNQASIRKAKEHVKQAGSMIFSVVSHVTFPEDGTYAYLGKGKKLGQKDEIIFWYKKPDGSYRALYGDLVFKDIKPEDLPK